MFNDRKRLNTFCTFCTFCLNVFHNNDDDDNAANEMKSTFIFLVITVVRLCVSMCLDMDTSCFWCNFMGTKAINNHYNTSNS